jgi:predicted transposase/invertase (TIGR01784 family)
LHLKDKKLEKQYVEYREQLSREGKIVYIRMGEREEAAEIERRGMEKGKLEGKLEVARNLLANGISPDIIAKSADLSLEKVRALMN